MLYWEIKKLQNMFMVLQYIGMKVLNKVYEDVFERVHAKFPG